MQGTPQTSPEAVVTPPKPTLDGSLEWTRTFCPNDTDVWDTVSWDLRTAAINDATGGVVFEQKDIEVPTSWSLTATNVVVSKYFRGHVGTPERETSIRQLIGRVADTVMTWGLEDGYFRSEDDAKAFRDDLAAYMKSEQFEILVAVALIIWDALDDAYTSDVWCVKKCISKSSLRMVYSLTPKKPTLPKRAAISNSIM